MAEKNTTVMRIILAAYFLVMLYLANYAIKTEAYTWFWDFSITFLIGVALYLLRKRLNLKAEIFLLFMLSLMLHTTGVYGNYTKHFFGISFDHYTHFFASLGLTMIFFSYVGKYRQISKKKIGFMGLCIIAILMALGASALHETVEFTGYTLLGQDGPNLYFPGDSATAIITADVAGDSNTYNNTMMDILMNMLGATGACIVIGLRKI